MYPATIPAQDISIPARQIGDDVAIYLSDSEILVSSKSEPNRYRIVDLIAHSCTCLGFHHRGCCRHLTVAGVAAEIERREAVAVLPLPIDPPARTILGATIWCADCGCAKAEIGVRCGHCYSAYWAD